MRLNVSKCGNFAKFYAIDTEEEPSEAVPVCLVHKQSIEFWFPGRYRFERIEDKFPTCRVHKKSRLRG